MGSFGPVPVILLVVAGLGWLAATHVQERAPEKWRRPGYVLVGLTVALVLWVGLRVAVDSNPLARAELEAGKGELALPAGSHNVSLVIHGGLPHVESGRSAHGTVTLEVADTDGHTNRFVTQFEEHWESRRISRKGGKMQILQVRDEDRIDLGAVANGDALAVSIASKEGEVSGPFTIEAIPSPPSAAVVGTLAAVLALAATALDGLASRRTLLGLAIGTLGVFACTLLANVTPHGPGTTVIGAAMISVIAGCGGAFALRVIMMALTPNPAPPPAAARA